MRVIAGILFVTDQRKITINHIDVQTQSNCSDCGVFSLAFATSLCQGEDPSIISYIAYQLRDHLSINAWKIVRCYRFHGVVVREQPEVVIKQASTFIVNVDFHSMAA